MSWNWISTTCVIERIIEIKAHAQDINYFALVLANSNTHGSKPLHTLTNSKNTKLKELAYNGGWVKDIRINMHATKLASND